MYHDRHLNQHTAPFRKMGHFARDCPNRGSRDEHHAHLKRSFGSFVGMVHDQSTTVTTKPGTPHCGERGWRDLFVLGDPELDGAVFLVTVFSPVGVLVAIQILS